MTIKSSMRSLLAKVTGPRRLIVMIKPDQDYVFLSGHGAEAQGQYLRGKVTLFVPEGHHPQGVQLKFTSRIWLGDHTAPTENTAKWQHKEETIHKWNPFHVADQIGKPFPNGKQYEWPFDLFIRGDQEETFKGCTRCSITYLLEVSTIHLDSSKEAYSFAPIRIIRTPAFSSFELMDPASAHGKWSTRAEYNVSIRHQAIALGGVIPIEAQVAELCSMNNISKARFYLRETHTVEAKSASGIMAYQGQRVITEWPLALQQTGQLQSWQQCLHLPLAMRNCSPDVSIPGITISHTLHFEVTTVKDGDTTQDDVSVPIYLFISPEMPINGWGTFVRQNGITSKEIKDLLAEGLNVPPQYCRGDFGLEVYAMPIGIPPPAYSECK